MALVQILLIWTVYAFVVGILLAVGSVFVHVYQTPPDRYPSVTFTCVIGITSLLATVLLHHPYLGFQLNFPVQIHYPVSTSADRGDSYS
jgi:hypothetical protein